MSEQSLTTEDVPLANGMPMLGLGTWQNDEPEDCARAVETALNMGYRHIDTAQIYGNEEFVGEGIENATVPREDIFLATKVWIDNLSYDEVLATTEESLEKLGVESVDLLYVHWPAREYDPEETFRAFNELYDEGKIDRIGISNFEPEQIETAVKSADVPIFANQVELHPLLQQEDLRAACEEHDIEVVAYSPLARGTVFEVPELEAIAEKHGVSEAQVSLAWLREKGVTAIPKATGEDHIRDNWQSLRVELDAEDIDRIDNIERTDRRVDPDFAPW
ncbi:aldo/keto reductase [Halogeometricum borinquense]|uniref:Aldo/keto reductase n=2 Tax=Halogeometricum borinquense TaxID=60847 RepID=E4NQV0_HALBP|nr:aldo/keto reductase, diketogulonate reductase [Halogeometricum borinquense DSM 11551]ELY24183.1 aldo/keto reductase [Halogeometricum borinquense DSM 11551]QIB73492.1 aldo/keto reductase [Halogeometricum borinquense]QIQ77110.1 aldo/keto reductase [Halogeometricum borinquense]RYJ13202.1 aldo/keto reductase [Halogeometricum borinquense]